MRNKLKIENNKLARTTKLLISLCCAAFGLLIAVSCVKDTSVYDDKEIRFGISNAKSRALITDLTNLESQEIGVYGYYTATERWRWSAHNVAPNLSANYFFNKKLEYNTTKSEWGYGTPKYWPPDTINKISFFAYSPYVDVPSTDPLRPYPHTKTDAGSPYLFYEVPTDVTDQVDLIWDSKIDMSHAHAPVVFDMKHALTRISFTAAIAASEYGKTYQATITEISLSGVHGTGDLDLFDGTWIPYTIPPALKADYLLSIAGADLIGYDFKTFAISTDYIPRPLIDNDHYLMLIPQDITDDAVLNFTLDIVFPLVSPTPVTTAMAVPLRPIINKWEAGQAIVFNLSIKGEFIAVTTSLTPWVTAGTDSTGDVDF